MSVFVDGEWRWYRPEWTDERRAYIDRLRADGYRFHQHGVCMRCGSVHPDPHINGCATSADRKNRQHKPDWGT